MQIHTNSDTVTTCAECGQPCCQREIVVTEDKHARRVPYQTHHVDLAGDEQSAVFGRVKKFYARMFELIDELQSIPADDLRLSYGRLLELDLGAVMPSACAIRTEIIPLAMVKVAGQIREIQLDPRALDSATVETILSETKERAEPIAAKLNADYEARDF